MAPLLKRAFIALEDGEFDRADAFCEQVLNLEPECGEAYLGKLLAELRLKTKENLKDVSFTFTQSGNFNKAMRFGDEQLKAFLKNTLLAADEKRNAKKREDVCNKAVCVLQDFSGSFATLQKCEDVLNELMAMNEFEGSVKLIDDLKAKKQELLKKLDILADEWEAEQLKEEIENEENLRGCIVGVIWMIVIMLILIWAVNCL